MNETKRYYIAYGSNLSVVQMARRCPDAKIVGTAILNDWQLLFKGCATIEPNQEKNTPVLIWQISPRDEKNLDRYEGFPHLYRKEELEIELFPTDAAGKPKAAEPVQITAMVYIMNGQKLNPPSGYYYKVLEDGYKAFHFPAHMLPQALADSVGKEEAKEWLERYKNGRETWE